MQDLLKNFVDSCANAQPTVVEFTQKPYNCFDWLGLLFPSKSNCISRSDEKVQSESITSVYEDKSNEFVSSGCNGKLTDAVADIFELEEFFGKNGLNMDTFADESKTVVTKDSCNHDVIQKYGANDSLFYEYRFDEQNNEFFRVIYDTNGDGVVTASEKQHPTFEKVLKDANNKIYCGYTKYVDNSGKYLSTLYESRI